LLVTKYKEPHNTAEELITRCAVEIASNMFDEKTASLIKAIPAFDNTIQSIIQNMSSDIVDQVAEKICKSKQSSNQLDEKYKYCRQGTTVAFQ
jgi:hypothetical protein